MAGVGCGSDDDASGRAAFARDAETVCVGAMRERATIATALRRAVAGPEPGRVFAQTASLTRRDAAVWRAGLDRLDALETPTDAGDAVQAWIADERRRVALSDDLAAAYAARDERRIAVLAERVDALAQRNGATARELGLPRCAGLG